MTLIPESFDPPAPVETAAPPSTLEFLAQNCPLFLNMTKQEVRDLWNRLVAETYPKDEVILREGRSTQLLWIIVRGRCEVFKTIKPGIEQRLTTLEPGATFGEMSFFQPAPHSASIPALSEVGVLRLSREQFESLEKSGSPAVCKLLVNTVKVLSERLRQMVNWTCVLVDRPDGSERHRQEWREFRSRLYTDWQF